MRRSDAEVISEQVQAIQQRLLDTTNYLRRIVAVVENMNRGAADRLDIAVSALEAVSEDIGQLSVHAAVAFNVPADGNGCPQRNPRAIG